MRNILGQFIFNFAIEIRLGRRLDLGEVFNGYWRRWGWSEFLFFAFLCRVCILLLVFLRSFFFIFVLFFRLFPFSTFLWFSVFFFVFLLVSKDFSVFCTFPGSCCRLSLSLRLRGNCKNPKKRKFRSDPIYTNPVRNFPSDAPFSRLRPNDPSPRLTNDTREDPITASHRPIANKNSPKIV